MSFAASFWSLIVFITISVALAVVMIGLSALLGQRHRQRTTGEPYESGMPPTGTARIRFDIKFYLIAVLFVIFDLETVFVVTWAVDARTLGWRGFVEIFVFIGLLLLALFYLWRLGALDWSPSRHRP